MSRFLAGQRWLNKRMSQYASVTVVYHYGPDALDFVQVTGAYEGRTAFRIQDQGNSRLIWAELDLLIPVERLTTNPDDLTDLVSRFKPQKGHWIEVVYEDTGETIHYEISAPQDEQAWRYADPQRTRYRVHLKHKQRTV